MDNLKKLLKIDDYLTSPPQKEKIFTKVKDVITQIKGANYQADLLHLPETKEGYKYLLVVCDLASNEFDIQPLKHKLPAEVLPALKAIFKRGILKEPEATLRTDNGTEFQGYFHQYLLKRNIFHSVSEPYRHKQIGVVEKLNSQLGDLLNGYMNSMETRTGQVYKEWTDILPTIREELNKIRRGKTYTKQTIINFKEKEINPTDLKPKYKVGDLVHYKLDYPISALGHKQPTADFRKGDLRYSFTSKAIETVYTYPGRIPFRYALENMPNVTFTEAELKPSLTKTKKYEVEKITNKRKYQGQIQYLIKWKGYPSTESTWEFRKNLIEDGLASMIRDYETRIYNGE